MEQTAFERLVDYYRSQGAPQDQQMLGALLGEVQEMDGGALQEQTLQRIAHAYGIKPTMLTALVHCIPKLHMAHAPNRLEMCHNCLKSRALAAFVEREYGAKAGCMSEKGRFVFSPVHCMKNCNKGAAIRWNGMLYSDADEELVRTLIG